MGPSNAPTFFNRSMIDKIQLLHAQAEKYARAGAYADAQKALLKVIHKSRANGSAWLLLGQVFGLQNAHADAENAFAQAARLNPRSLDAHAYLGLARMQQGKDEQAISAFKAALNIQPRLVMALANLVAILHKKDRQDDALLTAPIDESVAGGTKALRTSACAGCARCLHLFHTP